MFHVNTLETNPAEATIIFSFFHDDGIMTNYLTFFKVIISFINIHTTLFTLSLNGQVMGKLALVSFGALSLLEESTEHRFGIHTCKEARPSLRRHYQVIIEVDTKVQLRLAFQE